jgi:hypothetical protein
MASAWDGCAGLVAVPAARHPLEWEGNLWLLELAKTGAIWSIRNPSSSVKQLSESQEVQLLILEAELLIAHHLSCFQSILTNIEIKS